MKEYVEKHKRNTFDLSFSNNLTFKFGQLIPVFCKEVIPGDSFKIRPAFGLRLMPMVFPVQTKLNANLHFFYVRNRNLWKDWMDFIGRTKSGLVPPYIGVPNMFATGKLADYLGCPTTLVGNYGNVAVSATEEALYVNANLSEPLCAILPCRTVGSESVIGFDELPLLRPSGNTYYANLSSYIAASVAQSLTGGFFTSAYYGQDRFYFSRSFDFAKLPPDDHAFVVRSGGDTYIVPDPTDQNRVYCFIWVKSGNTYQPIFCVYANTTKSSGDSEMNTLNFEDDGDTGTTLYSFEEKTKNMHFKVLNRPGDWYDQPYLNYDEAVEYLRTNYSTTECLFSISSHWLRNTDPAEDEMSSARPNHLEGVAFSCDDVDRARPLEINVYQDDSNGIHDISEFGQTLNPYWSAIHVSALPFRAYESIYNAFYRNQFNDPFILNGQKEYNKFIRSNEGGSDQLTYSLFNRNYELDFLTSAKQSPVDGDLTPLVGVNASGKFTFQNQDGTTYTVTPQIGEDGHTLTGIESMEGVPENNSGLRRLVDAISFGISINDFRNVNALQRWLETNLRRGYRYRDQVMSHFGVDVSYEELDMPEFIGGMSNPVLVNKIDQHTDQTGNPEGLGDFAKVLGSFAGQGSVFAQAKHSITKYCDEHGFIIGILSVTPTPCYSQLLPKFFIKDNVLDYMFPEFGHIGNQPISYKEVCPIQAYAAGDALTDVFGYQRAWYDYVASVDEIHGDFRKSLDGFLITRVFDSKPELGKDFIECREDTMSNPFSVTDETDKILGQVYFDVTAQRPIPKFGIPRLE